MRTSLDNNMVDASKFILTIDSLGIGSNLILKKIKKNYKYVDGKRTEEFIDTVITVIDPNTYIGFDMHVEGYISISQEELENMDEVVYIEINPLQTFVRPYKIEYGSVKCKVSTEAITII